MKIDVKQPLLMRIRNWDATFEKASSRAVDRCSYVCVPNKQDSMGLMNVVELHDGMTIFGCYNMLLRLCSRQRRPDAKKEPEAAAIYWRDGWLTESGKKDGRRYSLQSLARNFRRPLEEIVRMVLVCSGEEVGWLEILEGDETYSLELEDGRKHSITITGTSASHAAAMPEPSASHEPAISEPLTGLKQSADSQPSASHEPGIDIRKEGRAGIEGRERTVGRVLLEESEEEAESGKRKAESRVETSVKKSDKSVGLAEFPEIGMDEAKDRLTAIAKGKRFAKFLRSSQWPYELQEALSRQLGQITREDLEYVEWAYTLPLDHAFFAKMLPRQSFEALVGNLAVESQKIRGARREMGLNGLHPASAKKRAEPAGWLEIYRQEYPAAETWPKSFWELTQVVRAELPALREKWSGNAGVELNLETEPAV